jgi:phenylpropionate dioxygenase-like ring-hydroxylating dioxygenase large terminal subunit
MARSPFPIPFGWFQVAWSADVEIGQAVPLQYFGRHQVLWRDEDGTPHVQSAFCPHLGAHLGHGGKVTGCQIACPFHGWRFDEAGTNTLIPYSERTNAKGRLEVYPTVERNGLVMAWYHPEGAEPMWDIPDVPEFNDEAGYTDVQTSIHHVHAPWQELAENGVDSAHFRYVHNTEQVPVLSSYETDGHQSSMKSIQKFPTPRGVVDGRIDADSYGPGFSVIHFAGIVDTVLLGCNTPVDDNTCEMRFTFTVARMGDAALESTVGDAFVAEINRQVTEDKPIWENKAYLPRPALADTDGPFTKFRRWASQFYFEPFDQDDGPFEPTDSYPADELGQSASQRYGSDAFA